MGGFFSAGLLPSFRDSWEIPDAVRHHLHVPAQGLVHRRANAVRRLRLPGVGAPADRYGQQRGPVYRRGGHADFSNLYPGQGAHFSGFVFRLHRAHHLWRADLGAARHPGRHGGGGGGIRAYQPDHPLPGHGNHFASAASHRYRAGHRGHRAGARARGREYGSGQEQRRQRGAVSGTDGAYRVHGVSGRHGAGLVAGARTFAPGAHPVRHHRGLRLLHPAGHP